MTTFEIKAKRENGTEIRDRVTAVDVKAAKRYFNEVYRHGKYEITGIEAVAENVPATKDQEREALEKIKAIIETLGHGSYISMSFEGAIEDAQRNIEDDTACSMADRWRSAEAKIDELENQIEGLKSELNLVKEQRDEIIEKARINADELSKQILPVNYVENALVLVYRVVSEYEELRDQAAERIVELAETPDSEEFRKAVSTNRSAKRVLEQYGAMARGLEENIKGRK